VVRQTVTYYFLQNFTDNACEAYWPIIRWISLVSFFKYWCNICNLPTLGCHSLTMSHTCHMIHSKIVTVSTCHSLTMSHTCHMIHSKIVSVNFKHCQHKIPAKYDKFTFYVYYDKVPLLLLPWRQPSSYLTASAAIKSIIHCPPYCTEPPTVQSNTACRSATEEKMSADQIVTPILKQYSHCIWSGR